MALTFPTYQKTYAIGIDSLIRNLQKAELCRDLKTSENLFYSLWDNIEETPNFGGFDLLEQAALYRYAGGFLCFLGKAKNLSHYQERGKDLLSISIDFFFSSGEIDKAHEAQIIQAYAYWLESGKEEFDAILETVESYYELNQTHENFLLLQINRLLYFKDTDLNESVRRVQAIQPLVDKSVNLKIKTQFHNHAGIICRRLGRFESALFHFEKSASFARESHNERFLANVLNNLGNLYRSWGKYKLAHLKVSEALDISTRLGDVGWRAVYLDTKANIYYDEKLFYEALDCINKAILFFPEGDDRAGYADALWLKTKIYFNVDNREMGFELFNKVMEVAFQIGEKPVIRYVSELIQMMHFPVGDSYKEMVSNFKRYVVENALFKANGNDAEAARELQMLPATMSNILRNQFPTLRKELQMDKERMPRTKVVRKSEDTGITRFVLTNKVVEFQVEFSESPYYFQLSKTITRKFFDLEEELLIAVIPVDEFSDGDLFLFKTDELSIGEIVANGEWGISDFGTKQFFGITVVKLLGRLVGYTPLSSIEKEKVKFFSFRSNR